MGMYYGKTHIINNVIVVTFYVVKRFVVIEDAVRRDDY